MNKWVYELLYRFPFVPISWIFGRHTTLVELVEGGYIDPGRAVDIGCGEGSNGAIFLAKNGFDVTGVDFSPTAIKRARKNALKAEVEVEFIEDDLTNLRHISGTFDLLVDIGALNDLSEVDRDLYMQNVLPLARPSSRFLLGGFKKKLGLDEIERRFGEQFQIEEVSGELDPKASSVGFRYFLMTRNETT
jgi:cyclopropane fatty-acyl-phospholipid synthase-like methyltransferase